MEDTYHENYAEVNRPSRNTTRMSNRIRKKTPPRQSPSRKSPSRRSPGRSPTSYIRKLPKRNTRHARVSISRIEISDNKHTDIGTTTEELYVSLEKKDSVHKTEDSYTDSLPLQSRLKETEQGIRRSARIKSYTSKFEPEHQFMLPRKSDRAVSLPVEKSNLSQELLNDMKERGFSVQRDQDLLKTLDKSTKPDSVAIEKFRKDVYLISEPQEWGGKYGAFFLTFMLPLCIILPQFVCNNDQCKFTIPQLSTDLNAYVNISAFFTYMGFLIILGCLSIIPVGKRVEGQQSKIGSLQYRINGMLCATVLLFVYGICVYNTIIYNDFILENAVQLAISGWILGTILSVILYTKAGKGPVSKLNIHACTNSSTYNFWQGREINPRSGNVDFKIILLRASHIGTILLNVAIVLKAVESIKDFDKDLLNSAVFLGSFLQILYAIDALVFESTTLTSFEILYEGTGYMLCITHLLYPFLPTLTTRFMLYEKAQLNSFFGIPVLFYLTGYILYRMSNLQKNWFRTNPLSTACARLETISTSRGKKLITSGSWGYVRHPNYFGDIVMQCSVPCILSTINIFPYYATICCTAALVYRALRDNARCKIRYGPAWDEYCSRVKYMIFKHLF